MTALAFRALAVLVAALLLTACNASPAAQEPVPAEQSTPVRPIGSFRSGATGHNVELYCTSAGTLIAISDGNQSGGPAIGVNAPDCATPPTTAPETTQP